jgi:hypothetical protein
MHVLEDEKELVVLFDQLQQLHDVGVVQFDQDAHLVEIDAFFPVFIWVLHSLDGHQLPRLLVQGLGDSPE